MVNEKMISLASKRLDARAKTISPGHDIYSLDINDIYKIGLTCNVIKDISSCIDSNHYNDISNGFFYLMGLLKKHKLADFGKDFIRQLIERIPELIEINQGTQACYYAIDFFVWLRNNYPNYRKTMLKFLVSNDLGQQRSALLNYETYCKPGEIGPLLYFEHNDYIAELSMRGPLRYQFRDIALEKVGKLVGKNFMLKKVSEYNEKWKDDVSFYDWQPFLTWRKNRRKGWFKRG